MSANEQVGENPTTPEPEAKPEVKEDGKAELMSALEKMGINDQTSLENMATASSQAGKAFNELGEARKLLKEQQAIIDQMKAMNTPAPDPYADSEQVDLGALIDSRLEGFWERQTKKQEAATEQYYREMNQVKSNPRYDAVKDLYEKHLNTPEVAMKLRQGQTTLTNEFNTVAFAYMDKLLKMSYDINKGHKPPQTPHVEQGETQSVPLPKDDDEKQAKLKRIEESRQKGTMSSDDAVQNMVKTFLEKDDPFWKRE